MRIFRVVIGDDDRAFRDAVSDVLTDDPRFAVVATVATGAELRAAASEARPDVALVDVRMPGGGAEAVRGLIEDARAAAAARDHPPAPMTVIAVSAHTGAHDVRAVVAAGASGYLAKGTLGATLPDLVYRCASGEVILAVPTGARALTALVRVNDEGVDSHR